MIAGLEAAIAYEATDKSIPSISYALFDREAVTARDDCVEPGHSALASDARFRVGSISKTFAALAALREADAGRLDLDADVSRYLGPMQVTWAGERAVLTLRRLLSHRSGLTREAGRGHYLTDDCPPLAVTVDSLRGSRLKVAPDGGTYRYSNAGYALVGACVEAASGWAYEDYLAEHYFGPMGLRGTGMAVGAGLAPARMWGLEGDRAAPAFDLGSAPAGAIVSTIEDIASYGRELLRQPLAAMAQVPGGAASGYGLGLMVGELDGERTLGHGGAIYGYASELIVLPRSGIGVVMIATVDVSNEVVTRLCRYALRLMLWQRGLGPEPRAPRRLADADATVAARAAGRYVNDAGAAIELEFRDGALTLIDRLVPMRLRPLGRNRFALDGRLRGEGTAHPGALLRWNGQDTLEWCEQGWQRSEAVAPVAPGLAAHVGAYAPRFLPTRLLEAGGQLVCVLEGLFPHTCELLGDGRYRLGPGMYQDEVLELGVRTAAGRAIRVGDMILEAMA